MAEELKAKLVLDGDGKGLSRTLDAAERDLADLSTASAKAAKATDGLDAAFKTLGIKSLQDVRAETEKLQKALATIKSAGVVGPDQERAVAAFKARLAELRAETNAIPGAAAGAKTAIAGVGAEARSGEAALGGMATKAAGAVAALVGFNAVTNVASDIIKTGAAFETLEARLTSLLGSTEAAKTAMVNIKALAISTPFEVSALAESFVKLTAFGLEPSMEQMRALADTAATLGGGTEQLAGVTLALGQAWAKGKLQGDEILQLAERGVPVWDVLAQATGKNTAELQKMSEAGELGRGTILKLIDALGKMNAGASEQMMATFSGAVSNAKDALAEFYDMIAQAGVLDFLTTQLQDLLAEFDRMKQTGELDAAAKRMADGFVAVGEGIRSAIEAINALSGVIEFSVKAFVAWRLAGMTLIPVLSGVGTQATATAAQAVTLAAGAEKAAVGMRAMAVAGRLLKGLTLVGLIEGAVSLGVEFLRAKKAAEDGDRAVKKMLEPTAVNGPRDAIKAIATETEAARFKLTEYQRTMGEMIGQGKAVGDALGEMVKKGDFSTVKGVGDFLNGLESIRKGAQATGEQIRISLQDRFNKMTAEDLRAFGLMAETAFQRGEISAGQLAATLNGTVDGALKQLGASAETFAGGMTAKFIEAIQQVGLVENSFTRLKETGQNASAILGEAFGGALNVAKSVKDFEGLEVAIKAAGEAGTLSKDQVTDFLDKIRDKVDALTPGVNSLAEAFKLLGMKSPEELKKAADAAEQAFKRIEAGSDMTKAGLANVREAFRLYAEKAIAANGGVATDTLRVQAEMKGLEIVTDSTGKSIVRAMAEAGVAVGEVAGSTGAAADGFRDMATAADEAAAAADRAATSSDGVRTATTSPTGRIGGNSVDFTQTIYQRGASIEEQKLAQKYVGEYYDRNKATMLTGNLGNADNAARLQKQAINDAVDKAIAAARKELQTGQAVDLGTSVNDIIGRNMSKTGLKSLDDMIGRIKNAGNEAKNQSIRVDLRTDRGRSAVNVASAGDASALIATLKDLQGRAV